MIARMHGPFSENAYLPKVILMLELWRGEWIWPVRFVAERTGCNRSVLAPTHIALRCGYSSGAGLRASCFP